VTNESTNSIPKPVADGLMKLEDLRYKVMSVDEFRNELARIGCLYVFDEYAKAVSSHSKNTASKNIGGLAFWDIEILHSLDSMVCGDYSVDLSVLKLYAEVYVDSAVKLIDRAVMLIKYDIINVENMAEEYEPGEEDEGVDNRE